MKFKNLLTVLALAFYTMISAQQPNSFVLAIPGQNLSFLNSQRTLITNAGNNGLAAGSVWRYNNLITTNGITIYGTITIKETNNASINTFDDEADGLPARFQPRITTTGEGYVLFELEFYEVVTNNRAYISDYYLTGVDIDGNAAGEFVEISGYSSYQVDATTQLTISQQPSGRTRFSSIPGDLNGVAFDNTASFVARYNFPYTKVTFALGDINNGNNRQYSLQFGTAGGTFDNPTEVRNPLKLMYITKTADTNNFVAGSVRKYTVTLDNVGSTTENVTLTDPLPAGISYVPNSTAISVPAANVVESVADNFNLTTYAQNNGTVWWKNEWTEIGETTNPGSGQININNNTLRFQILSVGRGIERSVNLKGATTATLTFDWSRTNSNSPNNSGILDVQISPDGNLYTSIGTINVAGTGNGTVTGSVSFTDNTVGHFTADTRIRLVNSGSVWQNRTITVDNLKLEYTLSQAAQNKTNAISGGTLQNGTPPNVIVSGDNITLLPGVKATITFDVNVDCNASGTIVNTATAAAPGLYDNTISASHTAYVDPVNVTGASRCNTGTVTLTASGAQGNQTYRWYAAASGGSILGTGASFTTPSISSTTDYYVAFYNPDTGCESGRTKVTATISSASITGTGVISTTTGATGTAGNTGTVAAPSTAANNNASGTTTWTNLVNIVSGGNNNQYASATNIPANGGMSQYMEIPFPTVSIPAGNVITGITVSIERRSSNDASSIRDNVVQFLKNNVAVGDNRANTGTFWPTADAAVSYGGDLWGTTWQASDFANTKLRIQVYNNANALRTAEIDYVSFRVDYAAFGDDQSNVSFTITGISGATGYTWTVPTGATITNGQGTDSILVSFNNAGQSGNTYNVCATPTNTCANGTQVCRTIAITNNTNNEISGTVYNDPNGSSGSNKVDGTPISQIGGQQLYAVLTQASNSSAISSVAIAPDGTYKFSNLSSTANNYYRIYIKTTPYGSGTVPTASDLPAGATHNGAIDNNDANSLTGGSTANGYLNVTAGVNTNNTNVNFGILIANPVANDDATSTLEDTPKTFNVLTNDTIPSGSINPATVDLDPLTDGRQTSVTTTNGTWTVDNSGNVTFTPVADYYGNGDSISYTVESNTGYKSNPATINVTVDPVNDAPSFIKGADQNHIQVSAASPYVVNGWATGIVKGPSNESLQTITGFVVTNNNNAMFTVQPYIATNGRLEYTLAPNAVGTAVVSVQVQDNGGTANGGIDLSAVQTFNINVRPDSDRDGIPDDQDLDDDNDGIPDEVECPTVYFNFADVTNQATLLSGSVGTSTDFITGTKLIRTDALTYLGHQYDAILTVISKNTPSTGTGTPAFALTAAGALALKNTRASDNPYAEFKLDFVPTGTVTDASMSYTPATLSYVTIQFNDIDGNNQAFSDIVGYNTSTPPNSIVMGSDLINGGFTSATNNPPASYNYYRHSALANDGTGTVPNPADTNEPTKVYMLYNAYTSAQFVFGITGSHTSNIGERSAGMQVRSSFACDTDGDGIPDQLDLDSDGDGCPDAIEGSDNVQQSHLNPDGSINTGSTGGTDINGIPNLVNPGGAADVDNAAGQGLGSSANAAMSGCFCTKPGTGGSPDGYTKVGILTKNAGITNETSGIKWPENVPNGHIVMDSENKGFVITHMTTIQRDALAPVKGMMIYNTTLGCVQIYRGTTGVGGAPAKDPSRDGWRCIERGCND